MLEKRKIWMRAVIYMPNILCGVNEEIYKVKDASERIGQFKFTRKLVCNIIITPSYEYSPWDK
ncbi:hypothetical protein PFBG_03181 [Plasmodium falciparum 7G8]|uniref:Uncharacterized protein n=1 Tax=Plasmodium falciparum (isolate 7G8) TaxID=57266 RepID=W7FB16_PLAF8|nr:hypothetical protein PFBG_03181 [Plasmodium falciparum 7G8]